VKTRRYSEVQIFRILQEVDAGSQVVDVARKHGVSPATIHRWKSKYSGMTLSELRRLKALEEENARLKRIVAQQVLDIELLKEINSKNGKPSRPKVSSEVSDKDGQGFRAAGVCRRGTMQIPGEVYC